MSARGTRLRPLTNIIPEHRLPVANNLILFCVLDQIREANVSDIGMVIAPETGCCIREAVRGGSKWDIQIT